MGYTNDELLLHCATKQNNCEVRLRRSTLLQAVIDKQITDAYLPASSRRCKV